MLEIEGICYLKLFLRIRNSAPQRICLLFHHRPPATSHHWNWTLDTRESPVIVLLNVADWDRRLVQPEKRRRKGTNGKKCQSQRQRGLGNFTEVPLEVIY